MAPKSQIIERVLDGVTAATLLFDASYKLIFINQSGEQLFGASVRHLLGMSLTDMIQHETPLLPAMEEAMASGHPVTRHEISVSLNHTHDACIDLTAIPMNEPDEEPALLIEITPINRLLRIARDEIMQVQQNASRDIMRGLAHEIKNPLGGLRGAAQLLEKQLASEELKEYTGVIIREADRLQTLLNRILGPNRIPEKRLVNIHEVLERVRSLVSVEVGEGIKLTRDYDPSIPEVTADPDQLVQALLNIIRNACQALNGNGDVKLQTRVKRKFNIGQSSHNLVARINIEDSGPGISEEIIDKIFFPMVTGRAEGTGLGLSISQSLIEQHGGLIECNSEPGHTVFSIFLPIESEVL
ncbi:MAG: nitrogen regulation protein NR(II) [Gammaproteobacteria bacterium]|nr:nitrogen regulation protein NR(II) [Gammaproteobacteria bacterium]